MTPSDEDLCAEARRTVAAAMQATYVPEPSEGWQATDEDRKARPDWDTRLRAAEFVLERLARRREEPAKEPSQAGART